LARKAKLLPYRTLTHINAYVSLAIDELLQYYYNHVIVTGVFMDIEQKRPYNPPRLVKAGSFEELTRAENSFENLVIFGLTGGSANLDAVS